MATSAAAQDEIPEADGGRRVSPDAGAYESAPALRRLSAEHKRRVEGFEAEIGQLRERAEYAEAIPLAAEILAIRQAHQGDARWETADALLLVDTLTQIAAMPVGDQRALAEGDATRTRTAYRNVPRQEPGALRRQLDTRKRLLGAQHIEVAASMQQLAEELILRARVSNDIESLTLEALAIRRDVLGDAHPDVAISMSVLAGILQKQSKYGRAGVLYRESLAIFRETVRDDATLVDLVESSYALLLMAEGDFIAAEPLLRRSLARSLTGALQYPWRVGLDLHNLGMLLASKGDHVGAERYFRAALDRNLAFVRNGGFEATVAADQAALAVCLNNQGRFEEAEPLLRESLATRREHLNPSHPAVASTLVALSIVQKDLGNYDAAETYARRALALRKKIYGDDHTYVASTLESLGWALAGQGDVTGARDAFENVLSIRRQRLANDGIEVAWTLIDLAELYIDEADAEAAERVLVEALAIAEAQRCRIVGGEIDRASFSHIVQLPRISKLLTGVLIQQNRPDEALMSSERGHGRTVLDLLGRSHVDLLAEAMKRHGPDESAAMARSRDAVSFASKALRSIEASLRACQDRNDLTETERKRCGATRRVEVEKGRQAVHEAEAMLLAHLREVWPEEQPSTPVQIRSMLMRGELLLSFSWTRKLVSLLVVPATGPERIVGAILANRQERVQDLDRLADAVRSEIGHFPLRATRDEDVATRRQLFDRLVPPELRDQILGAKRLIVVPDGPIRGVPLDTLLASVVETSSGRTMAEPQVVYADSASVFANRRRLGNEKRDRFRGTTPSALLLGDPDFREHEYHNPRQEVGVASGEMGRHLSEKPPTSEVDWLMMSSRSTQEQAATVSALDHVRLHGGKLVALPGTRHEVEGIAETIRKAGGEVTQLLDENAALDKLESLVEGRRFVHLATHGLMGTADRPFDASLALTPPDTPMEDDIGFLTLNRLIRKWRTKLEGCELVVLSACDTHRGVRRGDSVMALPWGFMYAGAPTVVASLWRVDDRAATLLMNRFYQNLLGQYEEDRGRYASGTSMAKMDALQEAKLWLRTLSASQVAAHVQRGAFGKGLAGNRPYDFSHPYFWASFVLIGDPG